jgi:hypothetical protein
MMRSSGVFVLLFSCTLLLVMGALDRQTPAFPSVAGAAFVAQTTVAEAGLPNLTAEQILARAAANLDPAKLQWLRYKIWQKQDAEDMSFEAQGRLLRGPNQCGRFELTVGSGTEATELLTVSDGIGLAHSCRPPGKPAQVSTLKYITPENNPYAPEQIEAILHAHSCGGPFQLLKDLEAKLENWQLASGTWNNRTILRLTGIVNNHDDDSAVISPRQCRVFLDAQTLWPMRVEWWAARARGEALFLEMEFRDAVINQPLSHEECEREFSFLPQE